MKNNPSLFKLDLKMKLSVLLLFTCMFALQANESYSQKTKVSVNLEQITVGELIDVIEEKTEYRFLYLIDDVDLDRVISIKVKKERVNYILDRIFKGTNTGYSIDDRQISLTKRTIPEATHQETVVAPMQNTIIGTVLDELGAPLPGANVIEKGTTNGVITDFDGNFSINVLDENTILAVSYIGFATKEIYVNGQTNLSITLQESAAGLEEVVVVGYGAVKRSDVTGAVSTVDSEDITALPVQDVQQALKGRAAGVRVIQGSGQPGSQVQIQIRGGNSYLGDNNPLYVVDGFPITGGIDFLNPSDIKTIDILKDASATAIYGSRGANGVVMITTKAGRKGEQGRIEFDSYYGVQQVIDTYDLMNTTQFAEMANVQAVTEGAPLPFDLDNLPDIETDWQDQIFRTAGIQSHTLTFSGGTEKSSYSVSGNYFRQEGIIINSGLKRGSFRIALDTQVNDWARLSANAVATRSENNDANVNNGDGGGNNIFAAALVAPP
ncbi:unnamed protein product, partial [Laminaria digitata]